MSLFQEDGRQMGEAVARRIGQKLEHLDHTEPVEGCWWCGPGEPTMEEAAMAFVDAFPKDFKEFQEDMEATWDFENTEKLWLKLMDLRSFLPRF